MLTKKAVQKYITLGRRETSKSTYLSLFREWTDSCPFVEACGFIIKEVLEEAEDEMHVVDRSKLLWLLLAASSAV